VNQDFLEMIVGVLSIRNIHNQYNNEELLAFGAQSISNLIPKIKQGELKASLVDKIMQLFLIVKAVKVRNQLSMGLKTALGGFGMISDTALTLICDLNKVRRGVADMEMDCD